MSSSSDPLNLTFSVKPRLLTLLGDQLIRDANLAVFELVKNAYDADAQVCHVKLVDPDNPLKGRICHLYTSPSPQDATLSRMPSSA